MNVTINSEFLECLFISVVVSILVMNLIEKFKIIEFTKGKYNIFLLNLLFSFLLGIPFSIIYFKVKIYHSIWISIFSFIGASNIYDMLQKRFNIH